MADFIAASNGLRAVARALQALLIYSAKYPLGALLPLTFGVTWVT